MRPFFPEVQIETYSDAIETALAGVVQNPGERYVLLSHQLVTGAERSESEEISIGGTDNIDAGVFADFDYVALGHLHRPQNVGPNLRYCGTPLKYSFSEADHEKSVTMVHLGAKGDVSLELLPLEPLRDLKKIRGSYAQLTDRSFYRDTDLPRCYLQITLTDEEDIPDAIGKLRSIYPYIMKLDYDNRRTRLQQNPMEEEARVDSSPLELFAQLYEKQNNQPLTPEQIACLQGFIEKIWEE